MASGFIKVSYQNASGQAIPPYGVIQLSGAPATNPNTGIISCQAVQPNGGTGPYLIDDGKGAGASGPSSYGTGVIPLEGATWAVLADTSPPAIWSTIGPKNGSFGMTTKGSGYWYAGVYDSANQRILAVQQTGGSGVPRVHFVINSSSAPYGYGFVICNATILDVTCNGTPPGLNYDGTITLIDPAGCYFNETQPYGYAYGDIYAGRHGYADYMQEYTGGYGYGYSADGPEYGYGAGCRWVVTALCCPPD